MNAHKFDAIHTNTYMFPARQTDRQTDIQNRSYFIPAMQ